MSSELPDSMDVIEIFEPGGPEMLVPATRPVPALPKLKTKFEKRDLL